MACVPIQISTYSFYVGPKRSLQEVKLSDPTDAELHGACLYTDIESATNGRPKKHIRSLVEDLLIKNGVVALQCR